jgi:hypothetical protein
MSLSKHELVETWSLSKHEAYQNMELVETWREEYFEHTLIKIFKPNKFNT